MATLVKVTSRAWALDILAQMHSGVPGRQAPLLAAVGASRTAFGQSLLHLVELGLLERNPGHGHPLRPEFRLTPKGAEIAKVAGSIGRVVHGNAAPSLVRRAWTIPVLAVTAKPRRFTEIKRELVGITDRALAISLDHLQDAEWVRRDVDTLSRPLRPTYQAASAGLAISNELNGYL